MLHVERLRALGALLEAGRQLWHPQPFREIEPAWCERWPSLATAVLALDDAAVEALSDDGEAARRFVAQHWPAAADFDALAALPEAHAQSLPPLAPHWAWEIPGRKRAQIEAFAAAVRPLAPVVDWCGGKGHLGRLFALQHDLPAVTLELDPQLCADGAALARRSGAAQDFLTGDALAVPVPPGRHAVALHACGHLHRSLLRQAANCAALDVAPCCYHVGVETDYATLSAVVALPLTRDDLRLAVTETVTAPPREARRRDRDMAWKLGFDALRRHCTDGSYRPFKPVPKAWLTEDFAFFCGRMAVREGVALPARMDWPRWEAAGWERWHQVGRYSLVRHAFRRPLEVWLACDMAAFLEAQGFSVNVATFCARRLTPRNLLISARR